MGYSDLYPAPSTRDAQALYSYPATALVFRLQQESYEIHFIWYTAAPAALFNNAPNGSVLLDLTNFALYVKCGTLGLKDGAWKTEALS